MKKRTILFVMFCILLCLSGCASSKKEEEPAGPAYDLGGKTYYNTVDNYGHDNHSKVWFGKDGSFVLSDSYTGGYYDIDGSWTLNENVVTLNVDKSGQGSYSKIIFEVEDNDTLKLKTTLEGSKSDDTFSINEIKGSSVKPADSGSSGSSDSSGSGSGGSSSSSGSDTSSSETKPDTSSEKIPCTGLTSLYKNYWAYEGVKSYDLEVKAEPSNTTDKITYKVDDENVVKVNENGIATAVNEGKTQIHIKCGDIERTVNFETRKKGATEGARTFKANVKDVDDKFQPTIYFDGAGNFDFTENTYVGMGHFKGTYKKNEEENRYYLTVTDASTMQGFAGADVKEIVFKIVDDKTLKLKTDLCMSYNSLYFYLQ